MKSIIITYVNGSRCRIPLYDGATFEVVEQDSNKTIKFSKEKYDTGYYDVVTRGGFAVTDIFIDELGYITATVPCVMDCRGNNRYGYLYNGRRNPSKKDVLDLRLVLK